MEHFNEMAKVWETPEKVALYQSYADEIKSLLSLNKTLNTLEIGSGTGLLGQNFIDEKNSYLGIDTSTGMLEVLKSKFSNNSKVQTLLINLEEEFLPSSYEKFNLLISAMCFHHLKDPSTYLQRIKNNLTNDAQIVVIDLLEEDGSFHPRPREMGVFHFGFSKETLEKWARENDLSLNHFKIIHENHKNDKVYPIFMGIFEKKNS